MLGNEQNNINMAVHSQYDFGMLKKSLFVVAVKDL
jgi:hypothetical protein